MRRIWYPQEVGILACASVVGYEEHRGPLGDLFDAYDETDRFGADTWEKAEGELSHRALRLALDRAGLAPSAVELLFAGDLQNQCVASMHGMLPFGIPYLGLYGACSTCTEGLLLASLALSAGVETCAAVTSSHNCAAERQFRLPLEYGGQRTPTAQWTATAAGAFVLAKGARIHACARITAVMAGVMVDGGIRDAANMGAAMAPAAARSICEFLKQSDTAPEDYDAIVTGDLGREGSSLLSELLEAEGVSLGGRHMDCGCMLYHPKTQDAHAGASGCGCSAAVLAAHFVPRLVSGRDRRILFLSTGALMSPTSVAQGENICGIAPVLRLEAPPVTREGCV